MSRMGLLRIVVVVACAALALSPAPPAVRLVGAIPLTFVLPGYALSLNILPRSVDTALRVAWTLALSIAVGVLLPIILGAAGVVLSPPVWIVSLAATSVAGELAARRFGLTVPIGLRRPSIPLRAVTALLVAAVVVVNGLYISWSDAESRSSPTATQLWMVPGAGDELRIGVTRYGTDEERLRLVVDDGANRQEYAVPLAVGQTFETPWQVDGNGSVVRATLYSGDAASPIREVFHRPDDG